MMTYGDKGTAMFSSEIWTAKYYLYKILIPKITMDIEVWNRKNCNVDCLDYMTSLNFLNIQPFFAYFLETTKKRAFNKFYC